jgi:hypothetical protein
MMYNTSYMNFQITLRLNTTPAQTDSLQKLQAAFAEACTALGPAVKETRCWNRVALHHLAYHQLREKFPNLGSQMVCNAIYSVSRSARLLFQNPNSPWCVSKRPGLDLPLLRFANNAPVYFDRHTLSLRKGGVSMYTLEGRLHFDVRLTEEQEHYFRHEKLREIVLSRNTQEFMLVFYFGQAEAKSTDTTELPEYVMAIEHDALVA